MLAPYDWDKFEFSLRPFGSPAKKSESAVGTVRYWQRSIQRLGVYVGEHLDSDITLKNIRKIALAFNSTVYGYRVMDLFNDKQRNEISRVLGVYGL